MNKISTLLACTSLSAALLATGCLTGGPEAAAPGGGEAPAGAAVAAASNAPPAAPKACAGETAPASDGLIDDFEDGDAEGTKTGGRGGSWYTGMDGKGSTITPSGNFSPAAGGADSKKKAAHFVGTTANGDGAWGASWGIALTSDGSVTYDASKYAGISFWAKTGDKSTPNVRFKVGDIDTKPEGKVCTTSCYNHFGVDMTLSKEWKQYTIKFTEMKQQDGWGEPRVPSIVVNKIYSLDWSVGPSADFDVWIDDIKFVECK